MDTQKITFTSTSHIDTIMRFYNWFTGNIKEIVGEATWANKTEDNETRLTYLFAKGNIYINRSQSSSESSVTVNSDCMTNGNKIFGMAPSQAENGKYVLNIYYIKTPTMFHIYKATIKTVEVTIPYSPGSFTFFVSNEELPMIGIGFAGCAISSPVYGNIQDSWVDVPINGLMNSVMVWAAQYSILNNSKLFRFKTGAMNFPSTTGGQFGVSGVGNFMILQASKSGDIVSGLAYKL